MFSCGNSAGPCGNGAGPCGNGAGFATMPGERIDAIGFGELRLIQKPEEFCYGVDAVILADFAASGFERKKKTGRIADLGTGSGIIPLILSHKTSAEEIYGMELQEESFLRAQRGFELNGLTHRLKAIHEDVANTATSELMSLRGDFDLVTSNPPYMTGSCGLINKNDAKTIARHETSAKLADFVKAAKFLLRDKGELCMVHRPSRLVDIFAACREERLEPKELRFVCPREGEIPNIVLVRCVKNGGRELKLLPPLYVYEKEGRGYSEEIQRIYERM